MCASVGQLMTFHNFDKTVRAPDYCSAFLLVFVSSTFLNRWNNNAELWVCAKGSLSGFDTWELQRHSHCERFTLLKPSRTCWTDPAAQHEAATAVIPNGDGVFVACRV